MLRHTQTSTTGPSGAPRRSRSLRVAALLATAAFLFAACGSGAGGADDGDFTPSKPLEFTAPADTGGGWDTLARTAAKVLEEEGLVDQRIQVVNKPGAGGAIGWAYMAGNAGDPHKLFMTSPPILLVPLAGDSDHDHTDFTPIARLNTDYMVYLVPKDSDIETFSDLADAAAGGDFSIAGGSGPGSMDHVALAGALQAAGTEPDAAKYVPFDGGGEAAVALLGGHVDAAVSGAGEVLSHLESGDLKAVGVTAPEQVDVLPDVPTLNEQGIDYEFDLWRGVMGPPDLTDEQVSYYESLFKDMLETDAWQEASAKLGWVDSFQGSEEFAEFLDEKNEEFAEILSEVGLR